MHKTADQSEKIQETMIIPVILSGGSGTRLWPLSRAMYPKQFVVDIDASGDSLLCAALKRVPRELPFAEPIVLTNSDYRFLVEDALRSAQVYGAQIVLEPVARNTAPAIATAAILASRAGRDAVIAVMPSDHAIRDGSRFIDAVRDAAEVAKSGRHVCFGIRPLTAHTGYGYIRAGESYAGIDNCFTIAEFLEKPDPSTADRYVRSGKYSWNSGIFVFHAETLLSDLATFQPELVRSAREAVEAGTRDLGFFRLGPKEFESAPSISIDHALMEKTSRGCVIPIDVGWSDIGSWSSLHDYLQRDEHGNSAPPNTILEDVTDTFVHSSRGLVAAIGVKDLIIVDTPDALLIADRSRSQDVGGLVKRLRAEGRKEQEQHVRQHRPWGYFECLNIGPRFQVKRLHVKPGGKLSMQMHHHRSEHWIVVNGTAKVTVGDTETLVRENESVYIVATQWHRLENPGKVPVELIEVQIGSYLGEDDIIRGDDIYRRAPDETK